jgi:hypothetical protein
MSIRDESVQVAPDLASVRLHAASGVESEQAIEFRNAKQNTLVRFRVKERERCGGMSSCL